MVEIGYKLSSEEHGPTDLVLMPTRPTVCPLCASTDTRELSRFGSTASE